MVRHDARPQAAGNTALTRRQFLSRGTAAAAAATAGPALLTGCGGGGSSSGPLHFWQFYAPGGDSKEQEQWFIDLVDGWNKTHEQQIKLTYVPETSYINGSKLQTAFSAGDGPDIFIISPGDFLRYYNGGVLQDLTPALSDEAKADFFPSVLATRSVEGKVYALPMEVEPMAMYYSIPAFEKAGLSEADVPKTWDQLLDVAGKLKKKEQFGVLFETTPGYYQNFTWYPFMWMGGANVVSKSGGVGFDSDATVAALEFWQETIRQGVAPRRVLGDGGGDLTANLGSGFCAIQNAGIWGVAELNQDKPDLEWGVAKLPVPDGGEYATDLGGWAFVANAKGKDPETAAEFCAWAIGSMSQESIDRGVKWCTEAKSDLAPRKSVQEAGEKTGAYDSGAMRVFNEEIFPGGRAEPRFPPEVNKPISDAIQKCQLSGGNAQQEAARAAKSIGSFLQSYSGVSLR